MLSPFFHTAYDPTDLPGGSLHPLGFERGYLALAEQLLPDLTNVANAPRYHSMLCAAAELARGVNATNTREGAAERLKVVKRFEKLWAAGNALAARASGRELSGLRGISYANRAISEVGPGDSVTPDSFDLLERQVQAGGIGIYGSVAARLGLLGEGRSLRPTEGRGRQLGQAFLVGTSCPQAVRSAATEPGQSVKAGVLQTWGQSALLNRPTADAEALLLKQAANENPRRAEVLKLLKRHPQLDGESELDRLQRIRLKLPGRAADLATLLDLIQAYEGLYQHLQLVFERVLWRCRMDGVVSDSELKMDAPVGEARQRCSMLSATLLARIDSATDPGTQAVLHKLDDVRELGRAAAAAKDGAELVAVVVERHTKVQHGKFDGGRRKLPWIEPTEGGLSLTISNVGGLDRPITAPEEVAAHQYRTYAADQLNRAAHV